MRFMYHRILDPVGIGIRVPADFFAVFAGTPYFFECKSTKIRTSFPFSLLRGHQEDDLIKLKCAGAKCYVLIKRSGYQSKAFAIDIDNYLDIKRHCAPKKSIQWDLLSKWGGVIELHKVCGVWQMDCLFKV